MGELARTVEMPGVWSQHALEGMANAKRAPSLGQRNVHGVEVHGVGDCARLAPV
jgi:hypothetical protein